MQPSVIARWRLVAEANVEWRFWDNEYVVHHALSNDTHRLSQFAGRLLSELRQSGSLHTDSLAQGCAAYSDEVAETLAVLEELDLVERC